MTTLEGERETGCVTILGGERETGCVTILERERETGCVTILERERETGCMTTLEGERETGCVTILGGGERNRMCDHIREGERNRMCDHIREGERNRMCDHIRGGERNRMCDHIREGERNRRVRFSNFKQAKAIEVGGILVATLYGPWNLDFFRALYDSICISPHITSLQAAAIDGSIGLYPLVLLCVLYSIVKLHDRSNRVFVMLWKPFHILLSRFRQKLNLHMPL